MSPHTWLLMMFLFEADNNYLKKRRRKNFLVPNCLEHLPSALGVDWAAVLHHNQSKFIIFDGQIEWVNFLNLNILSDIFVFLVFA